MPWQDHDTPACQSGHHNHAPPGAAWLRRTIPLGTLLYLAFTLPLLLTLALVTPAFQNADEPTHLARIVQIAHGELLGHREWGTTGGLSDGAIYDSYHPVEHASMHPAQRLTRADLQAAGAVRWHAKLGYTSFPNTAQYPPVFYLPGALAYWAGRAGGLSIVHTLLLIRLANALLFACIAAAAVTLASRTRPLLVALLLLPTTLSLACSAGQDSLLIAAVALATAILDRIVAGQRSATRAEALLTAFLLTAVAAARPPYAGFLAALLLLSELPDRRSKILIAASAAIVAAWCLVIALHVSVKLGGADLHAQLAFLANHMTAIPTVILNTAQRSAVGYWRQFIGVLGWTDTPLPTAIILLQSSTLAIAAASAAGISRLKRAPAAGAIFAIATIFILQYLTWTWPGQMEITGVLGRYFIPVAIILALALPGRAIPHVRKLAWTAIAVTASLTPAIMIRAELLRYYVN